MRKILRVILYVTICSFAMSCSGTKNVIIPSPQAGPPARISIIPAKVRNDGATLYSPGISVKINAYGEPEPVAIRKGSDCVFTALVLDHSGNITNILPIWTVL